MVGIRVSVAAASISCRCMYGQVLGYAAGTLFSLLSCRLGGESAATSSQQHQVVPILCRLCSVRHQHTV